MSVTFQFFSDANLRNFCDYLLDENIKYEVERFDTVRVFEAPADVLYEGRNLGALEIYAD